MIANAYYYGNTTRIEFNEKYISEIVPRLNDLFCKYGYKTEIFSEEKIL